MTQLSVDDEKKIDFDQLKLWCSNLKTGSKKDKIQNLERIEDLIKSGLVDETNIQEIYDQIYLHLLQLYSDKSEACRSLAISIVTDIFKLLPRNSAYLEYIMQVIAKRLAQAEIKEESEELRLELIEQIKTLVDKFKSTDGKEDLILTAYNDIIDILIRTVRDPYHAVQRESCEVIIALSAGAPCFRYRAEVLVKHLSLMLGHRYTVNRIAAIKALVECALHIFTNNNCVVNIIMNICRLLMDDVPLVRLQCGRSGIKLGLELKDRYSHFSKILPLILCCLSDQIEDVRNEISNDWLKVGDQFYKEDEEEMKKYFLVDKTPENYPEHIQRPTFQCRHLVQRHLPMVNIILHEMEEWQDNVRLHSVKLLEQVVIHSEKNFATQFPEVYPVLAHTCADVEADVAKAAISVSSLLGQLLEFDAWFDFAFTQLSNQTSLPQLICFTALFKTAPVIKAQKLEAVTNALLDSSFYHSANLNPMKKLGIQKELCSISKSLIEVLDKKGAQDSTEQNLYCILTKVIALSEDDDVIKIAQDLIYELAQVVGVQIDDLHQRHLQCYLDLIDGLDVEVEELSDPVILLCGVIQNIRINLKNIKIFEPKLQVALEHAPAESKIRLFCSIAAAFLIWDDSDQPTETLDNQFEILKSFIANLIQPSLQWSVGGSAEAVRCMASGALCAITQNVNPEIASKLIEEFSTDILQLIDDNDSKTRFNAVRILLNVGALEEEKLKPIVFGVLSRLDDNSQDVRLVTATVLGKLRPKNDKEFDWDGLLVQMINKMIIFCEAPEKQLKENLMESLKEIRKRDPEIYLKTVSNQKDEWTAVKDMLLKLSIND